MKVTENEAAPEVELPVFEPDPALLGAEALAREALRDVTADANVGRLVGHEVLGERLLNLRFECRLLAYPHWLWTVTLSRIDERSEPTVLEYELLPGDGALLSPEWVPWAERLAALAEDSAANDEGVTAGGEAALDADDEELDDEDLDDEDLDEDDLDPDEDLDVDGLDDELDGVDDLDDEVDVLDADETGEADGSDEDD